MSSPKTGEKTNDGLVAGVMAMKKGQEKSRQVKLDENYGIHGAWKTNKRKHGKEGREKKSVGEFF